MTYLPSLGSPTILGAMYIPCHDGCILLRQFGTNALVFQCRWDMRTGCTPSNHDKASSVRQGKKREIQRKRGSLWHRRIYRSSALFAFFTCSIRYSAVGVRLNDVTSRNCVTPCSDCSHLLPPATHLLARTTPCLIYLETPEFGRKFFGKKAA